MVGRAWFSIGRGLLFANTICAYFLLMGEGKAARPKKLDGLYNTVRPLRGTLL
jgi:hypothetical protein